MKVYEIIEALPTVGYGGHCCMKCKYRVDKGEEKCGIKGCKIVRNALDLINHQKAEIERLEIELKAMRGAANSYKAEVERLEKDLIKCKLEKEMLHQTVSEIQANAIKEFAERLENFKIKPDYPWDDYFVTEIIIDNLVTEMTEGGVNNG